MDCDSLKVCLMHFTLLILNCFLAFRAFVPLEAPPGQNSTQWEKVQYLFEELGSSRKYSLWRKHFNLKILSCCYHGFIQIDRIVFSLYIILLHSFHPTPSLVIFITLLKPHPWLNCFFPVSGYYPASLCEVLRFVYTEWGARLRWGWIVGKTKRHKLSQDSTNWF